MLIAILVFLFILNNALWLYAFYLLIQKNHNERWELLERIRFPEQPVSPPRVHEQTMFENLGADSRPVDEFDLVGEIDPETPLRNDNG